MVTGWSAFSIIYFRRWKFNNFQSYSWTLRKAIRLTLDCGCPYSSTHDVCNFPQFLFVFFKHPSTKVLSNAGKILEWILCQKKVSSPCHLTTERFLFFQSLVRLCSHHQREHLKISDVKQTHTRLWNDANKFCILCILACQSVTELLLNIFCVQKI